MRILYHHRTASKDGQAVHIDEMIRALRERGCDVVVVEPRATAAARFGGGAAGASALRRLLPKAVFELMELAYNAVAYARLHRAVLEHRPDVIYERHNLYLLAGKWIARRFRLPYLLEVNAPLALEREQNDGLGLPGLARRLERSVWKAADAVLPVTAVLGEMLIADGVDRQRIHVIPNGIDPEAFEKTPPIDVAKERLGVGGRLILGFTGFVRPWHGLDQVIDFIADRRRSDLLLLVVGDGPARASLLEHAKRRGVAAQVRFTGVIDRAEVPNWIATFDLALQPAATPYASPLKLFEYMALGRAIVAPNQSNIAEILVDGENGALFRSGDRASLFEALDRLVADPELRRRVGGGARETIRTRGLTWNRNAERVVALSERLVSGRGTVGLRTERVPHA